MSFQLPLYILAGIAVPILKPTFSMQYLHLELVAQTSTFVWNSPNNTMECEIEIVILSSWNMCFEVNINNAICNAPQDIHVCAFFVQSLTLEYMF